MSHAGSVDIIDFVLLTIYPVGALFIIEIISRMVNRTRVVIPSWAKLSVQGIVMVGFAVAYTVFISLLTTSSDPEILVAFRGHGSHVGWYAYSFWVGALSGISAGTFNGGGTISIHAHFNENVDVNTSGGTPTMTITNNQTGGGSAATLTASYASGSGGHVLTFTTGAGTSGQLASGNTIHIGANPFALNSGTIFEAGTSNPPTLTASSDVGNQGTYNKGGDRSHTNAVYADGSRVRIKA